MACVSTCIYSRLVFKLSFFFPQKMTDCFAALPRFGLACACIYMCIRASTHITVSCIHKLTTFVVQKHYTYIIAHHTTRPIKSYFMHYRTCTFVYTLNNNSRVFATCLGESNFHPFLHLDVSSILYTYNYGNIVGNV